MKYADMKNILGMIDNPVDRLDMVMEFGRQMPDVPDTAQCTEIVGCASYAEICRDGNHFFGRADSALVRGIVAIITAMVDEKTPQQIKKMDMWAEFSSLGLNLGTGRMGGVNSMIRFLQNL